MKIDDVDFRNLPQELNDFKDQIFTLLNFGKYQSQVTSSPPTWVGRRGEEVYTIAGTTGRLYVCSSDNSATWSLVREFIL